MVQNMVGMERGVDAGLNARLIACWQGALHTDDPEESRRWMDMAQWLAHRDDPPDAAPPYPRPPFVSVPLKGPALLMLDDMQVIRGEAHSLSRTSAAFCCAGPDDLYRGQEGYLTVRGWATDRPVRILDLEPGLIRLVFVPKPV
ncbi:hypothetical protein [Niveispirillum irakense]|uniref:hypothetical protein n=1 Tax=Niveispirillum irakense TaxID=34011 RepID=UPI000404EBFC|nr:hypothetical protein [Niveispirillum irakense]